MFDRQACLPRQSESYPYTGAVLGLCIFTADQSGPWLTGRTPEDPLVQDSLSEPGPGQRPRLIPLTHLMRSGYLI